MPHPCLSLSSPTFPLTVRYVAALGAVALLLVVGQILVQDALRQQAHDGHFINVAGRQRMLSQKLSKAALRTVVNRSEEGRRGSPGTSGEEELRAALAEWTRAQSALRYGDPGLDLPRTNGSPELRRLFAAVEPGYEAMVAAAGTLLAGEDPASAFSQTAATEVLLAHEGNFLRGMDAIVARYEQEAVARVVRLRRTETILFVVTLVVLLLEGLCVFRPAVVRLAASLGALARTEAELRRGQEELETRVAVRSAELARADRARRDSEENYHALFQTNPQPTWVYDLDTLRFLAVNEAAVEHYGYSREEFLAMTIADIRPPEDVVRLLAAVASPARYPVGSNNLWRHRRRDGRLIQVEIASDAVRFAGRPARLVVAVDVTVRRVAEDALRAAKEEAERANAAKSEFLSRMSHELRTPLNAILGFGQLLELAELGQADQQSVEHILKGGRHLLALIDEVLDIARIESGRQEFALEALPADDVLEETLDFIRPQADERRIRLEVEVLRRSGCGVLADRRRLRQVLLNLLSNAVKYNRDGGTVTVACAPDFATSRVVILVRDTGPGIAEEDLPRLFTPFERLGAEHRGVEGTGIGLTISKHLVEAMGGRLEVHSTLGQGSTFRVELPFAAASLPVVNHEPEVLRDRDDTPSLPPGSDSPAGAVPTC